MKCPRCGSEMSLDSHRKYPIHMCYNCGYVEGRKVKPEDDSTTNFEHMTSLNFNEMTVFLADGLGMDRDKIADWLDNFSEE